MMVQERPLDIDCKRLSPGKFISLKAPSLSSLQSDFWTFFQHCLCFVFFRPVQVQKGEANPGNVSKQKLQLR